MLAASHHWHRLRWATARVLFYAYASACILSVVAGYLTAPLFTWIFYGDWRFWRHVRSARRLWAHACRMVLLILQRRNGRFVFSVALTAPPVSSVDPSRVQLAPGWEFGPACGPCSRCCSKHGCPILDPRSGLCRGFDSFFWRYFNCGRYPTRQSEIDYYRCPKWVMRGGSPAMRGAAAQEMPVMAGGVRWDQSPGGPGQAARCSRGPLRSVRGKVPVSAR